MAVSHDRVVVPPINELRGYSKADRGRLEVANDAIMDAAALRRTDYKTSVARSAEATAIIATLSMAGKAKLDKYNKDKEGVTFDAESLAKFLELPDWESISERNNDNFYDEAYESLKYRSIPSRDENGDDTEALMEAQSEAESEAYQSWSDAIEKVASKAFDEFNLMLDPVALDDRGRPYEWEIRPTRDWRSAAFAIYQDEGGGQTFAEFCGYIVDRPIESVTEEAARLVAVANLDQIPAAHGSDLRRWYDRYLT